MVGGPIMLYISYIKPKHMAVDNAKIEENRVITDRFLAVMYQLIGMRVIRTKKEFGEAVGVCSTNIYRMEIEKSMNAPLYAIRRAHDKYDASLEYIFTGKVRMFNK